MKIETICLIVLVIKQLFLIIIIESRTFPSSPCVFNSHGKLCKSISDDFSEIENELMNDETENDPSSDDQNDFPINELDGETDYQPIFINEPTKKIKKRKKSNETKFDPLIPLLTQMTAKRKQINKNRKDDSKQAPNLNFQTQGWR